MNPKQTMTFASILLATLAAAHAAPVYRDLSDLSTSCRITPPKPAPFGLRVQTDGLHTIDFLADTRKLRYDGILVYLNAPILRKNNTCFLAEADLSRTVRPLLGCPPEQKLKPPFVIVLDPGHGGLDGGASAPGHAIEKKLVLDIARRTRNHLRRSGYIVRLTRTRDTTLSLAERSLRAKAWRANLFVSIHLNAAGNPSAHGIETYTLPAPQFASTQGTANSRGAYLGNRYDPLSTCLAVYLHKALLAATGAADRGVRRARYEVLRAAPCPAALVECGFLSNASERSRLQNPSYREQLARGLASGLLTYVTRSVSWQP